MKKLLGKYLFEVIVIFIGITGSFLFEEWRQGREREETAIRMMKSMVVELERNSEFINHVDTAYQQTNTFLQKMLDGDEIAHDEAVVVGHVLMEGVSYYRLKEISSFIHGFSSSDQLNILNKNKEVLMYLSYMESLLTEHEAITNAIIAHSSSELWPLLVRNNLADEVIAYQKGLMEDDEAEDDDDEKVIRLLPAISDEEWISQLKWSQLKILRLIHINQAIHRQVDNIIRELNRSIEAS